MIEDIEDGGLYELSSIITNTSTPYFCPSSASSSANSSVSTAGRTVRKHNALLAVSLATTWINNIMRENVKNVYICLKRK